ncbi:tyrosine-protein phosphatase non-receptor type 7-like [Halichondria panicea]|uniref:tyrosine-protein phosphatase non-receptor type 7-like n=1 Tax=Halichondria panicea TaxID=6063 RepID=UPI00312BB352
MGNVSGAFPSLYDPSTELLPTWAIAVVSAAVAVTLLWTVSIILLVIFEVLGKRRSGDYEVSPAALRAAPSQVSLGSPPPPVRAPPRRVSSQPLGRMQSSDVTINPGYHDSVPSLACDPRHEYEPDIKLSQGDSVSISSESSQGSEVKKKPLTEASCVDGATNICSGSPLAGMVLSRPVTVRQLGATLREPNYIHTEFKKLPLPLVTLDQVPSGVERKNRYSNVLPTPRSRVSLPLLLNNPASDYINANYMRGYKGSPRQYIATQGPLDNTKEDFWRMVWENRSEVIVMATNFQERGIDKCCRYWPASGSAVYGCMEVTLLSQCTQPNYSKTKLQVRLLGCEEVRCVEHYRLTMWPQQGVPRDTTAITDFLSEVRLTESNGPAVVHCSAGIGRTGVLIAVDIGMIAVSAGEGKLDILRTVSTLRQDRAGCVQTRDQYKFVHQCLYDYARSSSLN